MSKKNFFFSTALAVSLISGAMQTQATPFTSTSPTSFDVTTVGASTIGGVVMDLFGLNGAHVISQLAASSLHIGYASSNPFTIGTQTGLSSAVLGALGGGLQAVAFRFTLFDGDTGPGNLAENQNTLRVNGISFGNWSDVVTQQTDNSGSALISQNNAGGFRDNLLDTGWFHSQDASKLSSFFSSINTTQQAVFALYDTDPGDNYFDFRQGINTSLVNVVQAPVVTPPNSNIPEPATLALLGVGLMGLGFTRRRRRA